MCTYVASSNIHLRFPPTYFMRSLKQTTFISFQTQVSLEILIIGNKTTGLGEGGRRREKGRGGDPDKEEWVVPRLTTTLIWWCEIYFQFNCK